jgi:MFS family permease
MGSKQQLYLIFFCIFIFQMGLGIVTPVLSVYSKSFHIGEIGVGWIIAIYGLARVIADIPAAGMARKIGNPYAMAVGAICLSVGSALCGIASGYGSLLTYRFIAGAGAGITLVVGQSMVAANPGPFSRSKAMAYYQGFFLAGTSIGPLLGGSIAGSFGERAPFFVYAGLAFCVAILAFWLLQRAGKRADDSAMKSETDKAVHVISLGQSLRFLARDVPFLLIAMLTLLQHFIRTGGINGIIPLHEVGSLNISTAQIGYVMSLGGFINLAMVFIAVGLSDRLGRKTLIVPAYFMIAASLLAFSFAANYSWFLIGGILWGLGAGMSGSISAIYATDRVKGEDYGSAMALYRMLSDIGYVIGPLLLGIVSQLYSIPTALTTTSIVVILCTIVFAKFSPETKQKEVFAVKEQLSKASGSD